DYVKQRRPLSKHPLISTQFYTDGKDLFIKEVESTISASQKGQLGLEPILEAYLERIDRDDNGYPTRLFPLRIGKGKEQPKRVAIDPNLSSGQPVIAGTGIMVSIVHARLRAGETIKTLANDYGLKPSEIEEAIEYFEAA